MTTFYCTARIAKSLKVDLLPAINPDPNRSWFLTDFRFRRKRIFVAVHIPTLFSVSVMDVKNPRDILPSLEEQLDDFLDFYGIKHFSTKDIFNLNLPEFSKTKDRRIISTVNRLVFYMKAKIAWDYDTEDIWFLSDIQKSMHKVIFSMTGYEYPLERFVKILND